MNFGLFTIGLMPLLLWLLGIFIVFLIIRELVLWYWKISKIVSLLEKIEKNTRKEDKTTEKKEEKITNQP